MKLKAPTDGNCVDDQFIVAGQNINNPLPTICGINSGQHSKSHSNDDASTGVARVLNVLFACSVH